MFSTAGKFSARIRLPVTGSKWRQSSGQEGKVYRNKFSLRFVRNDLKRSRIDYWKANADTTEKERKGSTHKLNIRVMLLFKKEHCLSQS